MLVPIGPHEPPGDAQRHGVEDEPEVLLGQAGDFGELAHEIFKRDVYRPEPPELSGVQANFKDPQFTTAIGLIRYAQIIEAEREPKRGVLRKIGNVLWPFSRQ